jgi:outer membrane protein OmpA-like peptidoglycan-associated protein
VKGTIAHRGYLAAGAAAIVAVTAGCSAVLGASGRGPSAASPVLLTEQVAPSMLVVVAGRGGTGQRIGQVVTATGRPREDLNVLQVNARGRPIVASRSPAPATVTVSGKPAPPAAGASSYQQAQYQRALTRWRSQVAAAKRAVASRTRAETAAWTRGLRLQAVMSGLPSSPGAAGLDGVCAVATGAVTGLVDQAGGQFGTRRVLLLAVTKLAGMPPVGELNGDDVIVVTSFLPSAAVASAAQENLVAAGATRAAVLGPEVTAAQLGQLVTEGLSQNAVTDVPSGRALFANDSSALLPAASSILVPLVGPLRRPGASGIINGYASAPGGAKHNQILSQQRAATVAAFLEVRGVPQSRLLVVGHGATDLVAPGASGDNRRVVVVIEEPARSSF